MTAKDMIQGFSAVLIWSEHWRELADWYRDVLGLEVYSELSLPNDTGVNFCLPNGVWLWVGYHDGVKGNNADRYRIMICFDVESVAAVYAELAELGVRFILTPSPTPTGDGYVATALDPEDNIIQFFSDKP